MSKPLQKLKHLAVNKDVHSYEDLYNYIHRYCGRTLMDAVVQYRGKMEEFFDAMDVSREIARVPNERQERRI